MQEITFTHNQTGTGKVKPETGNQKRGTGKGEPEKGNQNLEPEIGNWNRNRNRKEEFNFEWKSWNILLLNTPAMNYGIKYFFQKYS